MNDNIFKLLIVFCFIMLEGTAASNSILASVGAIYVIPFLLLSSTAGTMADKFSKRSIIVAVKIAECTVMLLGMCALALGSKLFAFIALFLLACHSAIFAPCKYGIVPEIIPKERISKANGLLTSCTYSAIIIGTFLASFLTDITSHNFLIASGASVCFAFIGLYTALKIPKTAPSGSKKGINPWFLTEFFKNLLIIYKEPSLLSAVTGSAFFLFVGSYAQLNMIPFAIYALHLSDVQGGYLFLLTALGIGAGSLLAGKISGTRVELGLVPIGGFGIAVCCMLISVLSNHLIAEIVLVILLGVFGGIYLIPLDSYIQVASPKIIRGQVIATTNFLGFFGVLCSAGILYLLSEILGLQPTTGFFIMGLITLTVVTIITIAISGYVVRFGCLALSRLFLKSTLINRDMIPINQPSFFLSSLPVWPWMALLIGGQHRRLSIFVVDGQQISRAWYTRLFRYLISFHNVSSIEALYPQGEHADSIYRAVKRGTSIVIFCPQESADSLSKMKAAWEIPLNELSFFILSNNQSLAVVNKL